MITWDRKPFWTLWTTILCGMITMSSYAQITPSESFEALTSSTGQKARAVNSPSDIISGFKGNAIFKCAERCSRSRCCVVYQYCSHLAECQLYNYVPTNVTVDGKCKAFRSKIGEVYFAFSTSNQGFFAIY